MEIKPFERQVNYYETDKMGIVHHTNYIRYFEEARLDFMRQINCSAYEMEQAGVMTPNVDAYAKYLSVMRFEDRFTVIVKPMSFTGAKMKFEYDVIKDGNVCCTGYTTNCFVNESMKPLILKHSHPEIFARLTEAFNG